MLSISPAIKGFGQGEYYLSLAREDYYLEGGEPPGEWVGAEKLGAYGEVFGDELRNLMKGRDVYGEKELVQNASEKDRRSAWDLTFSAPKSVSVFWSQADTETRKMVQLAHEKGVREALKYLNEVAGYTRRGKAGAKLEKVDLAVATFEHGTSRAQDPQLHTHALVLNLCKRADGSFGTIEPKEIFRNKMTAGALYRAELSYQLEKTLGLESERVSSWFELKGVPKKITDEFSKRRKEIEKLLAERGGSGAVASTFATLDSRGVKGHVPRDELFSKWQEVGREFGFSKRQVERLLNRSINKAKEYEKRELVQESLDRVAHHESHFGRREILRFAAEASQGRGLSAREVLDAVDVALKENKEIVRLENTFKGDIRYSTRENLEMEMALVSTSFGLEKNNTIKIPELNLRGFRERLSAEQYSALHHVCSEGGLRIVSGMAGTGKSYLLGAAREAFQGEGYTVLGCALSGRAAAGLFEGSGIKSQTIHSLLNSYNEGDLLLDKKSVLVVDEAGMLGTKTLFDLMQVSQQTNSKLILVGDSKQLQPIIAGAPFSYLSKTHGEAALQEIKRQNEPWAREAVKAFSRGDARTGLLQFALHGQMHVLDSREETIDEIVNAWSRGGVSAPKKHMMITSTNIESHILNDRAQGNRIREEAISGEGITLNGVSFFRGDRVLFTKNSSLYGVKNGSLGTVIEVSLGKKTLKVEVDSLGRVSIPLKEYQDLKLGYAVTTHKSQGMTVDNAYVLLGGAVQDRESSYVQVSRSKKKTQLFTDRDSAGEKLTTLARQMAKSRQKTMSLSLVSSREKRQRRSQ